MSARLNQTNDDDDDDDDDGDDKADDGKKRAGAAKKANAEASSPNDAYAQALAGISTLWFFFLSDAKDQ